MSTRTPKHGADEAFSLTATGQSWAHRLIALCPFIAKPMQGSRTKTPAQGTDGRAAKAPADNCLSTGQVEAATQPDYGLVLELKARYLPSLFVRRIEHWGGFPLMTAHVSKEGMFFGFKPWELAVLWPGVQA